MTRRSKNTLLSERSSGKLKINPGWPNTGELNSCEQIWPKDVDKKSLPVPMTSWTQAKLGRRAQRNFSTSREIWVRWKHLKKLQFWYNSLTGMWPFLLSLEKSPEKANGCLIGRISCSSWSTIKGTLANTASRRKWNEQTGSLWKTPIFPIYLKTEICMNQWYWSNIHMCTSFSYQSQIQF